MKHRATGAESALIRALADFDEACRTAVDLYRRRRESRADWALVRAGRRVAEAVGVAFDAHPLGGLVYVDPFKITPADIAREQRARAAASTSSGAEYTLPGKDTAAAVPVERREGSAPESDHGLATGSVAS